MSKLLTGINKINTGQCPHGLPAGACPICSQSGGGLHQSDKNRKVGEMSYHECAMIGNMLKARALAQKNHEKALHQRQAFANMFVKTLQTIAKNVFSTLFILVPKTLLKPVVYLGIAFKSIPSFTKNVFQNIQVNIKNFIQSKPILFEISDKLAAIYGEIKNFINKKVSEIVSALKNGLKNIFRIIKKDNTKDDDTKIDDDKKIFNLKTMLHKIKEKFNKKKDKQDEYGTKN